MSYQVLARKWRPRSFPEMVGQEHVLKALINALDHGRLHHAYLFTGTRGVGKTTIARILAKSLNCEQGVSANPCGVCSACVEIDEGRFVDLIEVDAASRTKVEDTREILDNVQYAPTTGRYKVYLIDEVHMLSGHSFNALLKTLEEPPEHVKFLLATTDPQKLPVTILSRCLQFSLKAMSPDKIVGHLKYVLEQEQVGFDEAGLWALARAADGSMRDAMSLTDQAISFGGGNVSDTDVSAMLGTIDRKYVAQLLQGLSGGDGPAMLDIIASMAEQAPDFGAVLADLIEALHRIAIAQMAPEALDDSDGQRDMLVAIAQAMTAEDVQLCYQTALLGRRDLPLAPDMRSGFEMILLRMLLFKPAGIAAEPGDSAREGSPAKKPASDGGLAAAPSLSKSKPISSGASSVNHSAPAQPIEAPVVPSEPQRPRADITQEAAQDVNSTQQVNSNSTQKAERPQDTQNTTDQGSQSWAEVIKALQINEALANFARNCSLESRSDSAWTLHLHPKNELLFQSQRAAQMETAISAFVGKPVKLSINIAEPTQMTPQEQITARNKALLNEAEQSLLNDPFVKILQERFAANLDRESLRHLGESD